jgi:hypothetical protein
MRHSISACALTAIIFLLSISASQRAAADQFDNGFVTGTVSDTQTGLPIAGASVALQRWFGASRVTFAQPTATDPSGEYRFSEVVPGTYALIVIAPGYAAEQTNVYVQESISVPIDVPLKPLVTVAASVQIDRYRIP